jgi:hypothetical protein
MPGISNRIVKFAKFYNQLKILVVVVSPFVKRAPRTFLAVYGTHFLSLIHLYFFF